MYRYTHIYIHLFVKDSHFAFLLPCEYKTCMDSDVSMDLDVRTCVSIQIDS